MNIMDAIGPVLSGGALDSIGRTLGISPQVARQGLQAVVPTSIAGVADYAANEDNARGLLDRFKAGEFPSYDAAQANQALATPEASARLLRGGEGFLSKLFGGRSAALTDALSTHTGIGGAGISRLFGMALPLILGAVGKHALGSGLDARGLSGFLGQQKSLVSSLIPASVASLIGVRRPVAPVARSIPAPAEHRERSSILPWALAGLAGLVGLGWLASRRHRPERVSTNVPQVQQLNRAEIQPVAGESVVLQMQGYLDSNGRAPKRFVLEGLTFETDSARLATESRQLGDELVSALQKHPHATVQIIGYTDTVGDAAHNLTLSRERAASLGQYLIDHGIAQSRIKTDGMGAEHPRAPNDSADGQAKNRRVEVVLIP